MGPELLPTAKPPHPISQCPLCQSPPSPSTPCPTCINMRRYWDLTSVASSKQVDLTSTPTDLSFPGPGLVYQSPIYGNHVVASRPIETGELIILEKPLLVSPYGPSDKLPLCLTCHRDVALSTKCPRCKWPVCGDVCAQDPCHASNECDILVKNNVKSRGLPNEYFSIETLRCLLLRKNSPKKWARILAFEAHLGPRGESMKAKEMLQFISNFILDKCGLGNEFDEATVDHVVGVLSVNTFWGFNDLERYSSVLFDKVTLFAHDCNPNTIRKLIQLQPPASHNNNSSSVNESLHSSQDSGIAIMIHAARNILAGESITIQYVNVSPGHYTVEERRAELLELFYFHCTCSRCLEELVELELTTKLSINENGNEETEANSTTKENEYENQLNGNVELLVDNYLMQELS